MELAEWLPDVKKQVFFSKKINLILCIIMLICATGCHLDISSLNSLSDFISFVGI